MSVQTALVLGGGGVTGIAWEVGVLAGLAEAGADVTGAEVVIGTSAGSVVGAQLAGDRDLEELYAQQLEDPDPAVGGRLGRPELIRMAVPIMLPGSGRRRRARLGRWSMRAHPPGSRERVDLIRERIGVDGWGAGDLKVTAVETTTGAFTVFDKDSGVDLVDAVAASCAVPMVWPAVTIEGRHYMDGGARSVNNADLARGAERVVVLAPFPKSLVKATSLDAELERAAPRRSAVIAPDQQALADIGSNVLDPAMSAQAARSGRRQGLAAAARVRRVWSHH